MKERNKKISSQLLCMMLSMVLAFTAIGCGNSNQKDSVQESANGVSVESQDTEKTDKVLGEGAVKILFTVVDKDGNETNFELHTDQEMVGDALLEENLIAGEESEYGLYVKTVNGITVDYDTDGTYWAFYVNGEYASSGVDTTLVKEGESYSFQVEQ